MSTINARVKHFIPNFEASSVLLVAAIALGAASAAHAQTAAPAVPGTPSVSSSMTKEMDDAFARADVNKDGKLNKTEAEIMPSIAARFEQLDTNADGFISREEFAKAAGT